MESYMGMCRLAVGGQNSSCNSEEISVKLRFDRGRNSTLGFGESAGFSKDSYEIIIIVHVHRPQCHDPPVKYKELGMEYNWAPGIDRERQNSKESLILSKLLLAKEDLVS